MRRGLGLYVVGLLLLLAGDVLPWYNPAGATVWGWDVSVAWVVSGRLAMLRTPPAAAAVVLVAALVLAVPIVRGRRMPAPLSAAVAGAALGVCGLGLYRGLSLPRPVPPHAGIIISIAGAAFVAAGALVAGDEEPILDVPRAFEEAS